MIEDLSFKEELFMNLLRDAARVFGRVLRHQSPEKQAALRQALISGERSILVSVCLSPPEVAVFAQEIEGNEVELLTKIVVEDVGDVDGLVANWYNQDN